MGKFEIKTDRSGQFRFNLKAGNGQVILSSEAYTTKAACENGIASVRSNSGNDARYDRYAARNGSPCFNLKASNGQVIGSSEQYSTVSAMNNGIASVKKNAPDAVVADLTVRQARKRTTNIGRAIDRAANCGTFGMDKLVPITERTPIEFESDAGFVKWWEGTCDKLYYNGVYYGMANNSILEVAPSGESFAHTVDTLPLPVREVIRERVAELWGLEIPEEA